MQKKLQREDFVNELGYCIEEVLLDNTPFEFTRDDRRSTADWLYSIVKALADKYDIQIGPEAVAR